MTDEQIKQNAEEYIEQKFSTNRLWERKNEYDAFITGAHSRDEEIKSLEKNYREEFDVLKEELESLRKGFYERGDKLKELMFANNKLRNPLISVKEKLPNDKTKVLVQYIDGDCEVVWYRDKKFVCVVPDQQKYIGKAMVLAEGVMVEKPIFSVPQREVVTDIVTHWMPIPQPKGGEK